MGIRGELFSTRVSTEGRTYFFNVKENRMGDIFLTIVESKPTEADNFERRSIVIFRDNVPDFLAAFQSALHFMEKPDEGGRSGAEPGGSAERPGRHGGVAELSFDTEALRGTSDRGRRVPAGFAGSAPEAPRETVQRPKRRVVVRRKEGGPGLSTSD